MSFLRELYTEVMKFLSFSNSEKWIESAKGLSINLLYAIFYFILGYVSINLGKKIIFKVFKREEEEGKLHLDRRKAHTLSTLLVSVLRYTIYFFVIVNILERFNIKTSSILTVAGVGGVAIGFGAQSLVKDVITGFFILLEDQFSVGEFITVNGMTGTVEEMGLRITKIRDFSGALYIVPNSSIGTLTNFSRGNQKAIVDISIDYEENIDHAIGVMKEILKKIAMSNENIVSEPEVLGVQSLKDSEVVIRVAVECRTGSQWEIGRLIRREMKETFREKNIEIPYPKMVVLEEKRRDDKNG